MLFVFLFVFFSFLLSFYYVFLLDSRIFLLYLCPNHVHAHRHNAHLRFQQVPEFFPFISKLSPEIVVAKRVQKIKSCQFLLTNARRGEEGGRRKEEGGRRRH